MGGQRRRKRPGNGEPHVESQRRNESFAAHSFHPSLLPLQSENTYVARVGLIPRLWSTETVGISWEKRQAAGGEVWIRSSTAWGAPDTDTLVSTCPTEREVQRSGIDLLIWLLIEHTSNTTNPTLDIRCLCENEEDSGKQTPLDVRQF